MGENFFGHTGGKLRRKLREAGPIIGEQRKARREAKEAAEKQKIEIAKQQKIEQGNVARAESEVNRRKTVAGVSRRGRQSLIRTSPTGLATNLGGTTNG